MLKTALPGQHFEKSQSSLFTVDSQYRVIDFVNSTSSQCNKDALSRGERESSAILFTVLSFLFRWWAPGFK